MNNELVILQFNIVFFIKSYKIFTLIYLFCINKQLNNYRYKRFVKLSRCNYFSKINTNKTDIYILWDMTRFHQSI
jgi:hypothetical protein